MAVAVGAGASVDTAAGVDGTVTGAAAAPPWSVDGTAVALPVVTVSGADGDDTVDADTGSGTSVAAVAGRTPKAVVTSTVPVAAVMSARERQLGTDFIGAPRGSPVRRVGCTGTGRRVRPVLRA